MKRRSTQALLVFLLLSCAQHAGAQSSDADAPAAPRAGAERRAELEKKAVELLREAVSEAQGLKLVENRVRPQTAAASLLWTRDEQAARALFKSAAEALAAYGATLDPEDPQFYNAAQPVAQLRVELIQAVAQFDPARARRRAARRGLLAGRAGAAVGDEPRGARRIARPRARPAHGGAELGEGADDVAPLGLAGASRERPRIGLEARV
jgi:hypothetical protein